MLDTKRVILRVPADLPADGVHCGGCDMVWPHARWYCSAWGESPLEEDEGGLLRCEQCRAAEERVKTKAQIEALLDAGGHLQQIVDDEIADCSGCDGTGTVDWTDGDYCGPCPDCAEARAAYLAWDKAVAGLAAEEREQPESTAPICDACGPEGCRCEEDRR
jgi:hypothetical protein